MKFKRLILSNIILPKLFFVPFWPDILDLFQALNIIEYWNKNGQKPQPFQI